MSEMKYYIGKIQERNGEFENYETIMFKTDEYPREYLEVLAYEWYDINNSMDFLLDAPAAAKDFFAGYKIDEGWMWNDCMIYAAGDHEEVPKDIWDFLQDKRIFTNLYINVGNSVEDWVKLKEMYLK